MEFLLTEGSLSRALSICLSTREAPLLLRESMEEKVRGYRLPVAVKLPASLAARENIRLPESSICRRISNLKKGRRQKTVA